MLSVCMWCRPDVNRVSVRQVGMASYNPIQQTGHSITTLECNAIKETFTRIVQIYGARYERVSHFPHPV